jgi:fucose permease
MAAAGAYAGQAIVTRVGPRPVAVVGMVLLGTGCLLLAPASVTARYPSDLFIGLFVFGAGLGACSVAGPVAALSGVARRDAGLASGLNIAAF